MDEWFAICVGRAGSWLNGQPNIEQCRKDIEPRKHESNKSAWAYVQDEETLVNLPLMYIEAAIRVGRVASFAGGTVGNVLRRVRPPATQQLQAVTLLLLKTKGSEASVSEIWILSIRRAAIKSSLVSAVDAEHILGAYDWTHRELATKERRVAEEVVKGLTGSDYARTRMMRRYTVDELKPLLRRLLDARLLRDEYVVTARAILDSEW